jgi:hypothetical protein
MLEMVSMKCPILNTKLRHTKKQENMAHKQEKAVNQNIPMKIQMLSLREKA